MSINPQIPTRDACGVVSGKLTATAIPASFDPAIERARTIWTSGDFGKIAAGYALGAAAFVDRLALAPGETVLDVACGTGNLTIPAAKKGAAVAGVDVAANLLESARVAAEAESLPIEFNLGAAEDLPCADASFDTVISMFGVMFTGRPEAALAELLRVTRPGGRIALANWTPGGFVASMLKAHTNFVPPPAGSPSTLAWGDETTMRERLQPHASRVRSARFVPRTIELAFAMSPAAVIELFRECYGPTVRTFAALDAGRRAMLAADLESLWSEHNSGPHGTTSVQAEYTEVIIDVM